MNSRTSSSASFDLVAQNENDVADILNSQNNEIEPNIDKESMADQPEKEQKKSDQLEEMNQLKGEVIAKMEEFQKQQQHNIDESAKMEEFQKQQQHNIDESAKMEEFQKQQQHNIDESAKMEEFQKQQQHNIDESAKMEEFQKQQQHNIDESAKMEEFQKQQQHNIDSLTEAQKGNDLFRIAGAIVLFIFIIYAVNQLNAQKDYRFKMNDEQMNEMRLEMAESLKSVKAMVVAELENGNFSMAAHEEEEQTKLEELKLLREKIKQFELELKETKGIDPYRIAGVVGAIVLLIFVIYTVHRLVNKFAELEECQKQQQQNIDALTEAQNRKGLIPQQNRWNSSMCHKDLTLKPDQLIVKKKREANHAVSSVLAEEPISKEFFGISYFEVKILEKDGDIYIGLANKEMPLDKRIREHAGTYSFAGSGYFVGHEVEGCAHATDGRRYIGGKPSFGVRDVVGCGVNLATRQIFYTLNGQRLETAGLFVTFAADLFPCVTLVGSGVKGAKIAANFGPNFKYKL